MIKQTNHFSNIKDEIVKEDFFSSYFNKAINKSLVNLGTIEMDNRKITIKKFSDYTKEQMKETEESIYFEIEKKKLIIHPKLEVFKFTAVYKKIEGKEYLANFIIPKDSDMNMEELKDIVKTNIFDKREETNYPLTFNEIYLESSINGFSEKEKPVLIYISDIYYEINALDRFYRFFYQ